MSQSSSPIAVLISDIHFRPDTLELATYSLNTAIRKAEELEVPLIIAGDLTDTKAIIRGEVANRLIEIFRDTINDLRILILVGNHDLINEKGNANTLNFLSPYADIVASPVYYWDIDAHLIPYYSDSKALQEHLSIIPAGCTIIMHQGVQTAYMGHYVQDKTSLPKEVFSDFRVISGHYHRAQDIKCGRPRKGAVGLFSYIGNPYTLSFAEANDGPKGFQVLYDDGIMEQIPLNLRKHVIVEATTDNWQELSVQDTNDLVWVKIAGVKSELADISKQDVAKVLGIDNFKLDLIPTEDAATENLNTEVLQDSEILDRIIDDKSETEEQKTYLKALWRDVLTKE
jgi:DNA repair exonuclease SbcCD nuclease subunit